MTAVAKSPRMSERDFQRLIVEYSQLHGWVSFHDLRSDGKRAGWPDLVLIRPPEILYVELKAERGSLSQAQRDTLDMLRACGHETAVWYPSDEALAFERLKRR